MQLKKRGHAESDKQDGNNNHLFLLPSASHQILASNSEYNSYTLRSLGVSVQHGSRICPELLIPADEGELPFRARD